MCVYRAVAYDAATFLEVCLIQRGGPMTRLISSARILSIVVAAGAAATLVAPPAAPPAPATPAAGAAPARTPPKLPEGEANALLHQPFSPVEQEPASAAPAPTGRGGAGFIEASVAT